MNPSIKVPEWCCSVCSLKGKLQPEDWEGEATDEDYMEDEIEDEMGDDEDKEEGSKETTEAEQSCNVGEEEILGLIDLI